MRLSPIVTMLFLFAVGCAPTRIVVTYYTNPDGATFLDSEGHPKGQSPLTLYYEVGPEQLESCRLVVPELVARWVSGAVAPVPQKSFNVCDAVKWSYRVDRPANAPKYELDLWHAAEQAKVRELEAQTKLLKQMQELQMRAASQQSDQLNKIQQQQQYTQQAIQLQQIDQQRQFQQQRFDQQHQFQQQQFQQLQNTYRRDTAPCNLSGRVLGNC